MRPVENADRQPERPRRRASPGRPGRPAGQRRAGSQPRERGKPSGSQPRERGKPSGSQPRQTGRPAGPPGRQGGPAAGSRKRQEAPPAARAEGPAVGEVLPAETLDELRETARPHAFAEAARALADAVLALSEEEDPQAAVRAARAAKRAAPRAASVRELLGIALYQAGEFREARTELAAAQRISGRGDLAAMLADAERALGHPERAIALFERSDRARMEPDTAAELLLVAASAYGD